MANLMLGFAILFSFLALLLVCLGFATDNWIDVAVDRKAIKFLLPDDSKTDPNTFTRHRGIFKICYEGSDTYFLDNSTDVVSGNCLWIKGLTFASDENAINYEDEYDWRNHLIRSQLASTIIGMVALLAGVILSAVGCWDLSPGGFRLAGLIIFVGAFVIACGMGCFHGYDYLEREKISQKQQGIFPSYWTNIPNLDNQSKMNYGWSYIISWVGIGFSTVSAILLLCTAYHVQWDEDYTKYSEKKLEKKVKKNNKVFSGGPKAVDPYGAPPAYTNPAPSAFGPPVYQSIQPGPAPVVEVPVEVPVAVPVEPPQVIPVLDNGGYGYNDGYSTYGGGYGGVYSGYGGAYQGYGGYIDDQPIFGPAPYGETDRFWM